MLKSLLHLHRLRKNQWRPAPELGAMQLAKLRSMVEHAYDKVPMYRRRFDEAGFHPESLRTLDDIRRIPTITRAELQSLPLSDVLASNVDPDACMTLTTSGSSGMPLTVYVRPEDNLMKDMFWARTSLECGKRLSDRTAYFKYQSAPPQWYERLGLWRRQTLSVLDPAEDRVKALQERRPEILRGNAFELLNTANAALRMGVSNIRPRAVFSMGSLLDDHAREQISAAFDCEVYDFYGATELGCIAWECPEHNGLHINVDNVVLECLDGDQPAEPGQAGRIVCTSLNFFAMPFIRYELGDIGVLGEEPCACGRSLPLLTRLDGRADDFFVRADGQRVSPSIIVNRVKRTPGIGQFRLVQQTPSLIEASVIAIDGYSAASSKAMTDTLKDIMGEQLEVQTQLVEALPSDPKRKIRSMICNVKA